MSNVNEREVEASAFAAIQDAIRAYMDLDRSRTALDRHWLAKRDIEAGVIEYARGLSGDLADVIYDHGMDILMKGEM